MLGYENASQAGNIFRHKMLHIGGYYLRHTDGTKLII